MTSYDMECLQYIATSEIDVHDQNINTAECSYMLFQCACVCVCVFEVLTHQWFVNTAKLLEVLKVSLSLS